MTAILRYITGKLAAVKTAAKSFMAIVLRRNVSYCERQFKSHLHYLVTEIFSCFLAPDYVENLYLYERRVHKEKINCLYWLSALKKFRSIESESTWLTVIIDAGQLRRRVTDHTIFGLCRDELEDIESALGKVINHIGNTSVAEPLSLLATAVDQLENSFEHVLKVTAREPIVFVLFVGALRGFRNSLASDDND